MRNNGPKRGSIKTYRLYFEPKKIDESIALLKSRFKFASIFHGYGIYENETEALTVFEVQTAIENEQIVLAFAEELRALNSQLAVRVIAQFIQVSNVKSPV